MKRGSAMNDPFKIVVVTAGVLGTVCGTAAAVSSNEIGVAVIGNVLLWGTIAVLWMINDRINPSRNGKKGSKAKDENSES